MGLRLSSRRKGKRTIVLLRSRGRSRSRSTRWPRPTSNRALDRQRTGALNGRIHIPLMLLTTDFVRNLVRTDQGTQPILSILVSLARSFAIPYLGTFNVLRTANPYFMVVPQGKFCGGQVGCRRFGRKLVRHAFVGIERFVGSTEEPLTEGHIRFRLPALGSETVPLNREEGVVRTIESCILVRPSHFQLGLRTVQLRGFLNKVRSFRFDRTTTTSLLCRSFQYLGRNDEGVEFLYQNHPINVRWFGRIDGNLVRSVA